MDAPNHTVVVVDTRPVGDKDIGQADRDRKHKVPAVAEALLPDARSLQAHDGIQTAECKLVAHGSNLVDMVPD